MRVSEHFKFVQLLFPIREQEKVAVRLLDGVSTVLGSRVAQIHPNTGMEEILERAWLDGVDTVEFVCALEAGIAMDADKLPVAFEKMTFRELVECVANLERTLV